MPGAAAQRWLSVLEDPDLAGVTLEQQVACLKREVALRINAYPKWVLSGRLKQDEADRELRAMRAVLRTLLLLQQAVDFGALPNSFLAAANR